MSEESDQRSELTVSRGDVTVEKTFTRDEFPVPAVRFVVTSDASEPVRIRLLDDIPESFPMEGVGFHPEYESDNWTAYKDHRVEFTRSLEPGEEVLTVYGIRLDESEHDPSEFLAEPTVETVAPGEPAEREVESIEDIIGDDDSSVIREVLSGERESLPGLMNQGGVGAAGAADDG